MSDDFDYDYKSVPPKILCTMRGKFITAEEVRAEALEEAAKDCEQEAEACISDIIPYDALGAKLAHARAGALLTAAGDIRALKDRKP